MSMTVREALEQTELKRCKLVAGESGIENSIQYVDCMEVPDITPWLKKRELLITTGYSIKNDTGALIRLIESLYHVQAAGMVIKTRFIGSLPQEVLNRADELGLPVIEAPNDMFFTEMISSLMNCIVESQNKRLEFSEQIHSKFTELELSGGGLDEIAEMLYRFLGMPVIITDDEFKITALRSCDAEKLQSQFSSLLEKGDLEDFSAAGVSEETIYTKELKLLARKSRTKQHVCGYIFTVLNEEPLDEMNKIVLDHAVTTVALEFTKLEALNQHQNLMDDNFFVDIIMRNIKSEEEARYRAQYQKWPKPPLLLALFDINSFEECIQNHSELETLELKRNITSTIYQIMGQEEVKGVVISKSDRFFCTTSQNHKEKVESALPQVIKAVKEKFGVEMTAGYTFGIDSYIGLWEAHNEAIDAIKICRLKAGSSAVACIEDVRLEQAVLHGRDNQYLQKYVQNSIGKLEKYDKENSTDLMKILEELIRNMGVRTKTAEALFLHRNTLLYRIRKMEQLTGYDFSRNDHLLKLGLAMIIRPFL